jgi:glycosyltransferase involved in cell wall biosynthesis
MLAVMRDVLILCAARPLFPVTIFHFHASGLSDFRKRLGPISARLFDFAYSKPEVAIRLSESAPPEGPRLGCVREVVIANGICDEANGPIVRDKQSADPIHILFVGLLAKDKGVLVAIEAVSALLKNGYNVDLVCVGEWESSGFRAECDGIIEPLYKDRFKFTGVLTGQDKWNQYREADIFCFPSFFHSETFPVVLLEAMCFSLPIVSTRWRGIPDVVEQDCNAILAEPGDTSSCVEALTRVVTDPQLRAQMGSASRSRFLNRFTVDAHRKAFDELFQTIRGAKSSSENSSHRG